MYGPQPPPVPAASVVLSPYEQRQLEIKDATPSILPWTSAPFTPGSTLGQSAYRGSTFAPMWSRPRLSALGQRTDDEYVTRVAYDTSRGLYWVDSGTRLAQAEIDHYWSVIRSRGLPSGAPYIVRNVTSLLMPGEVSLPPAPAGPGDVAPLGSNGIPGWVWWGGAAALIGVGILVSAQRR